MVYESDYSTRRVYSSAGSRPGISTSYSYSPGPVVGIQSPITPYPYANQLIYVPCNVPAMHMQYAATEPIQLVPPLLPFLQAVHHRQHTVLAVSPYSGKGGAYSRGVPHIAHQRLVAVSPPSRGLSPARVQQLYDELEQDRVGPGGYGGGLNYIIVNVAPTPPPRRRPLPLSKISYIEDVTDHNNIQTLARETRLMRRDADNLMIRINEGLPPPVFSLRSIPLRSSGDLREAIDIRRRYVHERNNPHIPFSQVRNNIYRMSMYEEPDKLQLRGSGNLACLSYAGGRPIPKRRRFYPEDKIRDDVNFRSYYFKLRDAANYGRQYIKQIYQPLYRSKKTILGLPDEPTKERKEYESKWVTRALAKPDGPTPPPRKASAVAAAAETPKVKAATAPRQEVDVTLPGPKKSVIEAPEIKPKVENVPEEKVVVKIPKKEEEAPVPVEAKAEETFKVPLTPTKPEPVEPEPVAEPAPEPTPAPEPEPVVVPAEPEKPAEAAPAPAPEPVEEPKVEAAEPVVEATPPAPEPAPEPVPAEEPAAEPTQAPEAPPPEPEVKVEEPPPPPAEQTPAEPAQEAEVAQEASAPAEAAPTEAPAAATPLEAEATPSAAEAGTEDTGNKGEQDIEIEEIEDAVIEDDVDVQINEEVTIEEVCDIQIEENDLEIANPSQVQQDMETAEPQEQQQNDLDSNEQPEPEPTECELESEQDPSTNEDQNITAGVSIVVADIDGPVEQEPQDVDQSSLRTVEEIQADAERRRTDFARLLEEHAEIVGTVQRLEMEGGAQEAAAAIEN